MGQTLNAAAGHHSRSRPGGCEAALVILYDRGRRSGSARRVRRAGGACRGGEGPRENSHPGTGRGRVPQAEARGAWGEGDEPEWIVLVIVSSTFGAFFVRFFGEAGADAWRGLKKFAEQLRDSRREPTGPNIPPSPPHVGAIHFRDQYGNVIQEGIYPQGPPDDFWRAWQEIDEPDWSQLDGWFVWWDDRQEAWAAFEPAIGSDRPTSTGTALHRSGSSTGRTSCRRPSPTSLGRSSAESGEPSVGASTSPPSARTPSR